MIPDNAKLVFKGVLFDVYQWQQEMFDGTKKAFERLKRKDSVNVVPVLDDGRILLIDEEQPGRDPFVTTPGGNIEDGESPEDAVRRELLEETGYACDSLELWLTIQPYTKIEWTVHTFIARGCRKIGGQNLDSGEKIALRPVTLDEYFRIATEDQQFRNEEITREILLAERKPDGIMRLRKLLAI